MTNNVNEYCEKLLTQKHLEYKADHIPCTVQSTYFSPKKGENILTKRELILTKTDKVIFGIEYDANGNPAEVYTTDSKGNRVKLVTDSMDKNNESKNLPDLISERLETAKSKTQTKTKTSKQEISKPIKAKKTTTRTSTNIQRGNSNIL